MHIGIFGGAFDPPHVGHMAVVYYVLATERLDQVWMLPAHRHPYGKRMAPFDDRVRMCQLAATPFAGAVEVSRVESELPGDGRTVDTLEHLSATWPEHQWSLIVGADNLPDLARWKDFERIERMARVVVVGRQGFPAPQGGPLMPAVSSSELRAKLARSEDCSRLVPASVLEHALARKLYEP